MDVNSLKIAKVFSSGGDIHYVLPLFQREYTWEANNWDTLLKDLYAIYNEYTDDKVPEHFMGSLVVVEDGTRNGVIPSFRLVDGQQRLTTISLVLCALGRIVQESHTSVYNKIQKLLLNADETGDVRYKLFPTTKYGDRASYTALLDGTDIPQVESKIPPAFAYIYRELERKIVSGEIAPERFFVVLTTSLQVVLITLSSKESPYQIFESLNAKGKPLSQADLVRNYIAMKVTALDQEAAYHQHWAKIEILLQEQRYVGRSGLGELTAFLRHYLAMGSGILANQTHVYARFRDRIENEFSHPKEVLDELATLHRFATYYAKFLRPETEKDEKVRVALDRLNVLDAATAYPFLLALFNARDTKQISDSDLLDALATLENYLVRRYLAGEGINYLSKMFPLLWRTINPTDFLPSLRAALATRNYPSDNRIRQVATSRAFYENRAGSREKLILVFTSLNNHLLRFEDITQNLNALPTIEHVLPQTPPNDWKEKWKAELGPDWQQFYDDYLQWKTDLGDDWEQTYNDYLHTLGNLTLVTQKWQIKLSNKPFAIKKNLLTGQGLQLNKYFAKDISRWDEKAIQERAHALIDDILNVWPVIAAVPTNPSTALSGSDNNSTTPKQSWDEASTFAQLEAKCGTKDVEIARDILDWSKQHTTQIWWSDNSTEGSFVPIYKHEGQDNHLFVIRAGGVVETYFQWHQYKPAFAPESKRMELLKRLNSIAGVSIPVTAITKRPTFPLSLLEEEKARTQFFETYEWFIEQVKSAPTSIVPSTPNLPQTLPALQLEYWTAFSELLRQNGNTPKIPNPLPQRWMSFSIGRSFLDVVTAMEAKAKNIEVALNIYGPDRFIYFDILHKYQTEIEADIQPFQAGEMHWGRLPDKKICRIQLVLSNADVFNRNDWPYQHDWLATKLGSLHTAFASRLNLLVKPPSAS